MSVTALWPLRPNSRPLGNEKGDWTEKVGVPEGIAPSAPPTPKGKESVMRKFPGAAMLAALLVVIGLVVVERALACSVAPTTHSPPGTMSLATDMDWTRVGAIESNATQSCGFDQTGAQWIIMREEESPSDGTGVNGTTDVALTWWKSAPAYAIYDVLRGADELNVFRSPPAANMLAVTDEVYPAAAITTSELRLDGLAESMITPAVKRDHQATAANSLAYAYEPDPNLRI